MIPPAKPTFKEAFRFWLTLGFISFGGPAGQIAIMHEFLVEKKRWISESRFLHGLNYCMVLPGPEAQQLATYIGWLLHGVRGGLAAGILFILPSLFILLALSIIYVLFGKLPWVSSIFYGLKPAVIAVVVLALLKIGKKSLLSPFHYVMALFSFIGVFFFSISFPVIILISIVLGLALQHFFPLVLPQRNDALATKADEGLYYLNKFSSTGSFEVWPGIIFRKILLGICLWLIPVFLFYIFRSDNDFWLSIIYFFTKAAFVTFGGAYAVLPYVAQVSVEKFNWLTQYEMIDGLALGETTPGPLIMVLTFVGFMAGYNHSNGSIADGALGLFTTAFYTFLPCFLFIFIGAPIVERTKNNEKLNVILSFITASVVGVILNLCVYLGKAVLFPSGFVLDWHAATWLIISFVALYKFRCNMMLWIGISAFLGLLLYFLM
jgi:chromate transporter